MNTPLSGVSRGSPPRHPRVAVVVPCYNEELTVGEVVRQFGRQLPQATIYVFDNNSTDRTAERARHAGAIVLHEKRQGKGYVVQSMFQRLQADVYVMVDGDGTYPPPAVHALLAPILAGEADMVVGTRLHGRCRSQLKRLHRFGNHLFLALINALFRVRLTDVLSGYRAFSRRFVKDIPLFTGGFAVETELTIRALQRGHRVVEVAIDLGQRPPGSYSKIRWLHDGLSIVHMILALFRDYKPLTLFGVAGLGVMMAGVIPGTRVVLEFARTGLVLHLPSAILAVGLVVCGIVLITAGLIIHTILRRFQELDYKLQSLSLSVSTREMPGAEEATSHAAFHSAWS
jgi:hypothetical protein